MSDKIQTSDGHDRFVRTKNGMMDREMHPKVLKAQEEAQKIEDRKEARLKQRQRQ